MSAMVSSCVPALFIVPTTTVSPSSMLRLVMIPSIGDSIRTLLRLSLAFSRPASSCFIRRRWVSMLRSAELSSDWRILTCCSELSSDSLVVSPPFQSCCCRV